MDEYLSGDTKRFTWVSSGQTPSPITAAVIDAKETVVSSASMVSSGNGHYYLNVTLPTTDGYYVKETKQTMAGKDYRQREKFKIVLCEVD